ncbi:MAG: hypothetical protein Q7V63_00830 [Gammaproteobacteria bacterium]|nr:hypothetical protein [Gammaproteobacteria bacterium]
MWQGSTATKKPSELLDFNRMLITHAGKGRLAEVVDSLNQGADVNYKDSSGRTALWYAVNEGMADVVAVLIANGACSDIHIESTHLATLACELAFLCANDILHRDRFKKCAELVLEQLQGSKCPQLPPEARARVKFYYLEFDFAWSESPITKRKRDSFTAIDLDNSGSGLTSEPFAKRSCNIASSMDGTEIDALAELGSGIGSSRDSPFSISESTTIYDLGYPSVPSYKAEARPQETNSIAAIPGYPNSLSAFAPGSATMFYMPGSRSSGNTAANATLKPLS